MVPIYQGREIKGMYMALVFLETGSLLYSVQLYNVHFTGNSDLIKVDF